MDKEKIKRLRDIDFPTSFNYNTNAYVWMLNIVKNWRHGLQDLILFWKSEEIENPIERNFMKVHHIENSLLNFNSLFDLSLQLTREVVEPSEGKSDDMINEIERKTKYESVKKLLKEKGKSSLKDIIIKHSDSSHRRLIRQYSNSKKHRWNLSYSDKELKKLEDGLKVTDFKVAISKLESIIMSYSNFFVDFFTVLLVNLEMGAFRSGRPKDLPNNSEWYQYNEIIVDFRINKNKVNI